MLTAKNENLIEHVSDGDLVILADALAHNGVTVDVDRIPRPAERLFQGYLPTFGSIVEPHKPLEQARSILLHEADAEPTLLQNFYRVQLMAKNPRRLSPDEGVQFRKEMSLYHSRQSLEELHRNFNWVACYDATVDRHLIESTIRSAVEVIRYSTGLGPRRRHNLTVSSASRTRDAVVQRLASRLTDILPGIPSARRGDLAHDLVKDAKTISGDLILRAAGPGTYVNELLGIVAAKRAAESARPTREGEIESWVYLDDFAHWFPKGKYPDLLRIRLHNLHQDTQSVEIELIEAKCVDEAGFPSEARDAQRQVTVGLNRLQNVWRPQQNGEKHLDAPFWYDQLYQALLSNLTINPEQLDAINRLRRSLFEGNFRFKIQGHTYAFCHNGNPAIVSSTSGQQDGEAHPEALTEPIYTHHFNKSGLHRFLAPGDSPLGTLPKSPEASEHDRFPQQRDSAARVAPTERTPVAEETQQPELEKAHLVMPETPAVQPEGAMTPPEPVQNDPGLERTTNTEEPESPDLRWLKVLARNLERVIREYGIDINTIDPKKAEVGPTVTRFKIRPRPGERISRLQNISEDLVYRLALQNAPLIEPVRGTEYVGIDLPSKERKTIKLEDLLVHLPETSPGTLPFIAGTAPDGKLVTADLADCPHLLVGGATNSGKSVFLRSLLVCLLETNTPTTLRLLIVDPKRTDFSFFNGLPHLIGEEVITDPERSKQLLLSLTDEMRQRQEIMQGRSMKVQDFNQRFPDEALPMIVVIIDEYAQLVSLMSRNERADFEQELMQVAAVARATGIHLILATQRPSADVVTGVLKANLPASIAFKVATGVNSRIVIDTDGAQHLLGKGDMLFKKPSGELLRLQSPFIDEVTLSRLLERYK